ncbi:DNA polymerase III alpha subunit [Clostridiaceae bacterium JG1575]|nr:DNA polymerase III alpha subunit [Clostridiaceae bacterium JG1575]
MEFKRELEERMGKRLHGLCFKVLNAAYFSKRPTLQVVGETKHPLTGDQRRVTEEIIDEILGVSVKKIIITTPQVSKEEPLADEALQAAWLELYREDPIARRFLLQARLERVERSYTLRSGNSVLLAHMKQKQVVTSLEYLSRIIGPSDTRVSLAYEEALQETPSEPSGPSLVQTVSAPALSLPTPAKPKKMVVREVKGEGVLLGKPFKDKAIPIGDLGEEERMVSVEGRIFKREEREVSGGKTMVRINLFDETGSITAKTFVKDLEEVSQLKVGTVVRIKGKVSYSPYDKDLCVMFYHALRGEEVKRSDRSPEKRIELHAHTNLSAMDGLIPTQKLMERALAYGHKALAITDHGVVQAFAEAQVALDRNPERFKDLQIIYGMEAYVVDDETGIFSSEEPYPFSGEFVVFDIETTGFSHVNDAIIEIGAVKIAKGMVVGEFSAFVNPKVPLPAKIVELTQITDAMLREERTVDEVLPEFLAFCGSLPLVAHNANFDMGFIRKKAGDLGLPFDNEQLDTVPLARFVYPQLKRVRLDVVAKHLNLNMGTHHRAVDDAQTTANILLRAFEKLEAEGISDTQVLNRRYREAFDLSKPMPYHMVVLVKNQSGMRTLYELVTQSHLKHFSRTPRLPKSLLREHRENLLFGSACTNSELFRAILDGRSEADLLKIASFYDYLELQPLANYAPLLEEGRTTAAQMMEIQQKILSLGRTLNRPVVATGDVHILDPEDAKYRQIITYCHGFSGAGEMTTPLPYYTTEEMLDHFAYLGPETARSIVIDNPQHILSLLEPVRAIPKGKFPPVLEGAEEEVREITMNRARELYGDPLPKLVLERLEKELSAIIDNGYAALYLIARKLVKKSYDDGYLVGSRGSVGSSLVATFMNITEVNGLPPHYRCPACRHTEFIRDGSVGSGVDLPEKICPQCQTTMLRDGHDIPFETFMGFSGDKEPDIDLNFSGDNQGDIHRYCEVLFGEGYVFRAGTIGTVAEKTALGYVHKFLEEKGQSASPIEIERLALGLTGVKRTTGQHPGGIMVVPSNNNIHNFCPVQYPADDQGSATITSHFDYHSISECLLKLDILGHDDPTVLRMLKDTTGIDPVDLPLDDPLVLGLFNGTDSLGLTKEELESPVGTLGIPEFGTRFVRQMLVDTNPHTFSDLVLISGLSHGTDVWVNNAQEYIRRGDTDLKGCISLRDNIMLYLIEKKMAPKQAFDITEKVRKGKGVSAEQEALMRAHEVPDWYIESCKKIKYMFPKGHAVAYVTSAVRIGWYKVHRPAYYYAAYFSIRAKEFDLEVALRGENAVRDEKYRIQELGKKATPKEQGLYGTLELVFEMLKRGFRFLPVDLYKSHATRFQVDGNSLIPPFNAINGVGDNAALAIHQAAQEGEFLSKEDFKERTKATRTVVEALEGAGVLKNLGETNQLSFFG